MDERCQSAVILFRYAGYWERATTFLKEEGQTSGEVKPCVRLATHRPAPALPPTLTHPAARARPHAYHRSHSATRTRARSSSTRRAAARGSSSCASRRCVCVRVFARARARARVHSVAHCGAELCPPNGPRLPRAAGARLAFRNHICSHICSHICNHIRCTAGLPSATRR